MKMFLKISIESLIEKHIEKYFENSTAKFSIGMDKNDIHLRCILALIHKFCIKKMENGNSKYQKWYKRRSACWNVGHNQNYRIVGFIDQLPRSSHFCENIQNHTKFWFGAFFLLDKVNFSRKHLLLSFWSVQKWDENYLIYLIYEIFETKFNYE